MSEQYEALRLADDEAVDRMAAQMKVKLAKARAKGRSGWQDPSWTAEQINAAMHAHMAKGDPVDVANYCMFLALRGHATTAPKLEIAASDGQDEMLKLAQRCEALSTIEDAYCAHSYRDAATFLRRLHAEIERLTAERDALQALLRDRAYIQALASSFSLEKTMESLGQLDPSALAQIKERP